MEPSRNPVRQAVLLPPVIQSRTPRIREARNLSKVTQLGVTPSPASQCLSTLPSGCLELLSSMEFAYPVLSPGALLCLHGFSTWAPWEPHPGCPDDLYAPHNWPQTTIQPQSSHSSQGLKVISSPLPILNFGLGILILSFLFMLCTHETNRNQKAGLDHREQG